ncbi:MAG: Sua5/YciO/YrdC/YwlC family protein [Alphaproteobacteria bacterium]|jgi:tRNA A37 threonylcarbamoyladenosine synthetase subunit TsaC/SUA5/YrdC
MLGPYDFEGDAERAMAVLRRGGIAILPMDVGYSLIGGSKAALARIFEAKGRAADKLNAMVGDHAIHEAIHLVDQRAQDVVQALTVDAGLPLGVIAPCDLSHPLLRVIDLDGSNKDGTIALLMNAGSFHGAISRLSLATGHPLFGSSANRSLQGTKFRVEDMEPEITAIADIIIDYGLRKYHPYGASSTLLDVTDMTVVRKGACFELITDTLRRRFDIALTV